MSPEMERSAARCKRIPVAARTRFLYQNDRIEKLCWTNELAIFYELRATGCREMAGALEQRSFWGENEKVYVFGSGQRLRSRRGRRRSCARGLARSEFRRLPDRGARRIRDADGELGRRGLQDR